MKKPRSAANSEKPLSVFTVKLMVNIEGGASMWMAGDNSSDCAMIEVALLGHASDKAYDDMSASLCEIMNSVSGIAPSRVYIKYAETEHWGFNGGNL